MKKRSILIAGLASAFALTGCVGNEKNTTAMTPVHAQPVAATVVQPKIVPEKKPELLKITGIGYGAESTYAAYTSGQGDKVKIKKPFIMVYKGLY